MTLQINESDILKDCFEPISAEANPEDTLSIETQLSPQPQKRERVKRRIRPGKDKESTSKYKRINSGSNCYRQ